MAEMARDDRDGGLYGMVYGPVCGWLSTQRKAYRLRLKLNSLNLGRFWTAIMHVKVLNVLERMWHSSSLNPLGICPPKLLQVILVPA